MAPECTYTKRKTFYTKQKVNIYTVYGTFKSILAKIGCPSLLVMVAAALTSRSELRIRILKKCLTKV